MEELIFRRYMKMLKDDDKDFWKVFIGLPKHLIIVLGIVLMSIVGMFYFSGIKNNEITSVCIVLALGSIIALCYASDMYSIDNSSKNMEEYVLKSNRLGEMLKEFHIVTLEDVQTLLDRINKNISSKKSEKEARDNKMTTWIQAMVIPIILVIISDFGKSEENFEVAITQIFIVIIFMIIIGVIILTMLELHNLLFKRRKVEQMQYFAAALQGVVDIMNMESKEIVKK